MLGVLPGLIGTVQATEAIKLLLGIGDGLIGRLLLYDALRLRFREIVLPRDAACPVCGEAPTIRTLVAYSDACEGKTDVDMAVEELHQWRREERAHVLVDVREPAEAAICRIDGSLLVPLGSLPDRLADLPTDRPIVVHCKVGGRSARATVLLRAKGFDAHNLTGGIAAWTDRIDPTLTRY